MSGLLRPCGAGPLASRAWPTAAVLLLLASGCGSSAAGSPGSRTTDGGRFVVHLASSIQPVPVNRIHSWSLHVATPDGRPVDGATIKLDGGMPAHSHGLPTVPQVVPAGTPGDYLVQGLKFSMTGHWTLTVTVFAGGLKDAATFDVDLP